MRLQEISRSSIPSRVCSLLRETCSSHRNASSTSCRQTGRSERLYFLICSSITTVIDVVASLTFLAGPVGIALATGSLDAGLLIRVLTIFVFASLVALPLLFVAGFFVSVLFLHAFIRLIAGRDQKGLPATLRVSCYAVGAPVAVAWIPLAGILAVSTVFTCTRPV
jgi:hypothetical protein